MMLSIAKAEFLPAYTKVIRESSGKDSALAIDNIMFILRLKM
jgi:hypothetical protein